MTSVRLSKHILEIYEGEKDFVLKEVIKYILSPVPSLTRITAAINLRKLQESILGQLDSIIKKHNLQLDQSFNSKTSEIGKDIAKILHDYEQKLCGLIASFAGF
ncbi:MAG: hypothetical protein AB7V77_04480 [Candidatus Woesearchaeota archaeon]